MHCFVPLGALIFLIGVFLPVPLPPEKPEDEDTEAAEEYYKAIQRRGRLALARLIMQGLGALLMLIAIISGLGGINDTGALAVFTALFGGLILIVQRAELNRRMATLLFMAFCGMWVWYYAVWRDSLAEASWANYAALLLNLLFWLLIGQRYPPGTSKSIQVWGMDE